MGTLPGKEPAHAAIVDIGRGATSITDPSNPILCPGVNQLCCQNQIKVPREHPEGWGFLQEESTWRHWPGEICEWFDPAVRKVSRCVIPKPNVRCVTQVHDPGMSNVIQVHDPGVRNVIQDLSKTAAVWRWKNGVWLPLWNFVAVECWCYQKWDLKGWSAHQQQEGSWLQEEDKTGGSWEADLHIQSPSLLSAAMSR